MARRKARPNSDSNQSTPVSTYTVTVNQGRRLECDSCCLPSATVYSFADGSTVCETCVNGLSDMDYILMGIAGVGGLYGGDY
jgi:hypothetical protein